MSWGEIAGLIAAAAAVVFVCLCAVPLVKLGGVMDELRLVVRNLGTSTTPILEELRGTVGTTTQEIARLSEVTEELTRMSHSATSMAEQAATMAEQAATVSTVVTTPLVRTAEVVTKASSAARDVGRRVSERRPRRRPADVMPITATPASPDSLDRTPGETQSPASAPGAPSSEHAPFHEQGQL